MCNLKIRARAVAIIVVLLSTALSLTSLSQAAESAMDTGAIERLTAAKFALDEKEGVFKVSVPRKDLSVIIAGVKMSHRWVSPHGRRSSATARTTW